jgi:hypothetical protein
LEQLAIDGAASTTGAVAVEKCQAWLTVVGKINSMTFENPKECFELLLSNARQGAAHTTEVLRELSRAVRHRDINEVLETQLFVSDKILDMLDQCFKLLGAQLVKVSGRLQGVFIEKCRAGLADIQSQAAARLFVLAKASELIRLRSSEYVAVTASADMMGHCGLGLLIETCVACDVAFIELTKRTIGNLVEAERVPS